MICYPRPEEESLFQASHPFAFFDYFRVPYQVSPSQQWNRQAGAPAFVRVLTPAVRSGARSTC